MIKLKIRNEYDELFLRIRKDNHILVENELGYRDLYLKFYQLIKEKQDNLVGYFDDKLITSKDFILIDLMDLEELLAMIQYKKGSLLFDYVNRELLEKVVVFDNDFYNQVSILVEDVFDSLGVSYQLEDNNLKLIQSLLQVSIDVKNIPSLLQIINKLLLKILSSSDNSKKYIIFYNSSVLNIDFSNYECCYSFDVNKNLNISKYNLLSTNQVLEFHLDVVQQQVKLLWPTHYTIEMIFFYLERYFKYYLGFEKVELTEQNEIIMASIIKKLFGFNQMIIYDSSFIEHNIKSFLTYL